MLTGHLIYDAVGWVWPTRVPPLNVETLGRIVSYQVKLSRKRTFHRFTSTGATEKSPHSKPHAPNLNNAVTDNNYSLSVIISNLLLELAGVYLHK